MMDKKWTKPELIVLTRSNPEESVLTLCKNTSNPVGANQADKKCNQSCGVSCSTTGNS